MKDNLLRFGLQLLLCFSSFSMGIVFYLAVVDFGSFWGLEAQVCKCIVVFISFLACLIVARLCIWWLKKSSNQESADVIELNPHEAQIVPSFVGMFVVSLSLASMSIPSVIIVSVLMFLFWGILCHTSYYNPFFTLFGYRFYQARLNDPCAKFVIIITKKDGLKSGMKIDNLRRINNYTFMEF